ncbi:hypothetical protein CDG60_16020 [Acinetobacter chinensis]|uniref:Uncharacterized protein n=1 Tax=Acinetobacter chinensis TaxID=2004650 RepID=A0A3B7M193_9GAMM|nr:hypothetical protein [Acinetobacter chinensis]AXY57934.1 hypothetical protein CDG60_16020 [Acinetobacter chinensis]
MKIHQILVGAVLFVAVLGSGAVQAEPANDDAYCSASYGDAADLKHVVSSVFTIRTEVYIYNVEVERYFQDYVDAEFGVLSEYPECFIRYDTYQEAADKRHNEISDLKNKDNGIVQIIRWSYHDD